jgi:hypothetical protein
MLEEARMAKLVSLSVTGASKKDVTGTDVWAAVQKKSAQVVVEVTTEPKNSPDEWKLIKWTGGKPVKSKPNQRAVDRDATSRVTIEVEYDETKRSIELWIVSASIEILTSGPRPKGAAPRDRATRDGTEKLGAVTYSTVLQNGINDSIAQNDPDSKNFVFSTGASGKIIAVATQKPTGVSKVIKTGWTFRRQVLSRIWQDGFKIEDAKTWTKTWVDDTSGPTYLRLTPDDGDKIYDLDEPDLRFGRFSTETYNNFRQWIEWNGETCSEFAPWYWNARWRAKADPNAQIELNNCDKGNIGLPDTPHYPQRKTP